MEAITWVEQHWDELVEVWGIIVLLASAIIRLIPELPAKHWALPYVKFIAKVVALNTNAPAKRPKQ